MCVLVSFFNTSDECESNKDEEIKSWDLRERTTPHKDIKPTNVLSEKLLEAKNGVEVSLKISLFFFFFLVKLQHDKSRTVDFKIGKRKQKQARGYILPINFMCSYSHF